MKLQDEQPRPEKPSLSEEIPSTEVTFPENPTLPEGFTPLGRATRLPRARRRRAHRMLVLPGADERAVILDSLGRRATPSFEFFLFAIFCGAVLGAAYLMDAPAMLLLGLLLAPLLTPWVGMMLATLTGSWRFFFLTLGGLLVAGLLVFVTGVLAGLAGHLWLPLPLFHANIHLHLWWPDLFIVVLGAAFLAISFIRSEQKPVLSNIMLAYGLFLPLSAGGVGLGLGILPIWPNGILVFLAHLALSILVGGLTLAALRFKPLRASGYLLPFLVGLLSLAALAYLTGLTKVILDGFPAAAQSAPTPITIVLPSMTPTSTLMPTSTPTPVPSSTPIPSSTPTVFPTPEPTPSYAIISASQEYGGAYVRTEPVVGTVITTLVNGSVVQVLDEVREVNGSTWVRIRMENSEEGWVLQDVLKATTRTLPTFTFVPTLTP